MKSSFLVFFCTFMLIAPTQAQDSITFISGRVLYGLVKDFDSLDIQFEFKKRKKTKVIYITRMPPIISIGVFELFSASCSPII